jgi:hypothetical protein
MGTTSGNNGEMIKATPVSAEALEAVLENRTPEQSRAIIDNKIAKMREAAILAKEELILRREIVVDSLGKILKDGHHYANLAKITGLASYSGKKVLLKAGAEAICNVFKFTPQFEYTREEVKGTPHYKYLVKSALYAIDGTRLGEGVGLCSSQEKKYNRPNPADIENTVLKMAKKRALVDVVIATVACSDILTQDLEDNPELVLKSSPSKSSPPTTMGGHDYVDIEYETDPALEDMVTIANDAEKDRILGLMAQTDNGKKDYQIVLSYFADLVELPFDKANRPRMEAFLTDLARIAEQKGQAEKTKELQVTKCFTSLEEATRFKDQFKTFRADPAEKPNQAPAVEAAPKTPEEKPAQASAATPEAPKAEAQENKLAVDDVHDHALIEALDKFKAEPITWLRGINFALGIFKVGEKDRPTIEKFFQYCANKMSFNTPVDAVNYWLANPERAKQCIEKYKAFYNTNYNPAF